MLHFSSARLRNSRKWLEMVVCAGIFLKKILNEEEQNNGLQQLHRVSEVQFCTWIRERSRMVRMQGGHDVDYPVVISMSCQRGRCVVTWRPAGRRGEDRKMHLFGDNAINIQILHGNHLKPSRIQVVVSAVKEALGRSGDGENLDPGRAGPAQGYGTFMDGAAGGEDVVNQ